MAGGMRQTSGGEMVVQELIRHRVERLYCVPGESYLAVIDALYDAQEKITQVTCRHESGAGMMALAEAELTGRPAACFVTRGPGATNASISVHIANQASIPMVLCIGQVSSSRLNRESFQEMDYQQFFGGICKAVVDVQAVENIPRVVRNAFAVAGSGRPGPVVLVFPEDVLRAQSKYEYTTDEVTERELLKSFIEPDLMREVGEALVQANKPIIIAGSSVWSDKSAQNLQNFSEQHCIPVFTAFRRNDVINNNSICYAGYLGLNQHTEAAALIEEADCILVLAARLDEPTTADYSLPTIFTQASGRGKRWIHVYSDFDAIPATPKADLRLVASAEVFLSALGNLPMPSEIEDPTWMNKCRNAYEASSKDAFSGKYDPTLIDIPLLMNELNLLLPDDAIVTIDAGNFTVWAQRLRKYSRPGRFLAPINGAMGFGVPAGIAASLVHPERTVVSFVGDGGMLMTGMELATAVRHGAKPIIIVFNNGLYGTIDSHQTAQYPGRQHGNDLSNPDFVQFAESFGAASVRVTTVHDFANAFLQAKQLDELTVIELYLQTGTEHNSH